MARKEGYRWRRGVWRPTQRQREVLDLLAEGKSNAEIAVRLGITLDGAKWHVSELLAETGCEDRRALARWWREERAGPRKLGLFGLLSWRRMAIVAGAVGAGLFVLAVAASLTLGRGGLPEPQAGLQATPTPWPEEALEARAASQGPSPATCEPPVAQDMRIIDASELAAQGMEQAGRVIVPGHCPLYVANRADRAVIWAGGGALLHFDRQANRRLMTVNPCCALALLTVGGAGYQLSGSGWSEQDGAWMTGSFTALDQDLARIEATDPNGAYVMLTLRAATPAPGRPGHRVAFASDGQMFIDPAPLAGDTVTNGLTGETIDVSDFGAGMPLGVEVGTGALRTDCWEEHGLCYVYLDGVRGARPGDTGIFSPPVVLAPFDGVLSCVPLEGEFWSIDGPALAYELSNGNLTLRIGAIGGAWEAWNGGCEPRDVRRGQEIEAWAYTRLEGFVGGVPVSIVATRDGRLYVGDTELELGCPCEPRS